MTICVESIKKIVESGQLAGAGTLVPRKGNLQTACVGWRDVEDLDKCYWASVAFGVKLRTLAPDVAVEPTFTDYAKGRDPVLESALTRIK